MQFLGKRSGGPRRDVAGTAAGPHRWRSTPAIGCHEMPAAVLVDARACAEGSRVDIRDRPSGVRFTIT